MHNLPRTLPLVLSVLALFILAVGCTPPASTVPTSSTPASNQAVRASGHLRLPVQQWLSFDRAGTIRDILVKKGDRVSRGQPLARLDDADTQAAVQISENSLRLQELALNQAELAHQTALLDLANTRRRLEEAFPPSNDTVYTYYTDVPAMRSDVAKSQELLKSALDSIAAGRSTEAATFLNTATKILATAYQSSFASQFVPLSKTAPVTQSISTLRQLEYDIERARAAVETAAISIEQARAGITGARLALDNTRRELTRTTLTAPFEGLVSDVPARSGDRLGAATYATSQIIRLVDTSVVEMEGFLDELDRPRVNPGGLASVTLDALPGLVLEGELAFISPVARVEAGVVSYAFSVRLRTPYPVGIAEGMSATAAFTAAR